MSLLADIGTNLAVLKLQLSRYLVLTQKSHRRCSRSVRSSRCLLSRAPLPQLATLALLVSLLVQFDRLAAHLLTQPLPGLAVTILAFKSAQKVLILLKL